MGQRNKTAQFMILGGATLADVWTRVGLADGWTQMGTMGEKDMSLETSRHSERRELVRQFTCILKAIYCNVLVKSKSSGVRLTCTWISVLPCSSYLVSVSCKFSKSFPHLYLTSQGLLRELNGTCHPKPIFPSSIF